jgi:hypothetical protein
VHVPVVAFQEHRGVGQSVLVMKLWHGGPGGGGGVGFGAGGTGAGGAGVHVPKTAVAVANGRAVISPLVL